MSPPETTADLAIWIFKPYRRQGYGSSAFTMATKYAVEELKIGELHAGAYPDNIGSIKMLKRCGYAPYPAGNILEKHYITGKDIIQMDYRYNPITIRLAVPTDAPDMAEVHMRSWEVAYKNIIPAEYINEKNATRPELYKRIITNDNKTQYVIRKCGETVGIMCVVATPQDDDADAGTCELEGIYLHPNYYRQGIGTQAMSFAFDLGRSMNKKTMTLWVFTENTNTIKFYEKCGFVADGKTKTYDMGKAMGCIRMRRDL
ncbi:MAG: GNAT family N-acetyltransferase [Clostridia bacterium]|nr:GNAT family N-acetyltransferase [Clostridia bacterium]